MKNSPEKIKEFLQSWAEKSYKRNGKILESTAQFLKGKLGIP